MTSDAGGPGGPVPGQPQPPEEPAPPPGEWPAELTPPPTPTGDDAPTAPVPPLQAPATPAAAPSTGWGAQPAAPAPAAPAPEPTPPAAAPGGWGQPAAPAPAAPPVPTTAPGARPGWGASAQPTGGWGAPPAGTSPGQPVPPAPGQPGPYGVPPGAPPPGWVPAAGAGVPPGAWNPQAPPPKSGNGCLKACLIVGIILVVLGVLGIVGMMLFARSLFEGVGINPDGTLQDCPFLPDSELDQAIGRDGYALPLTGFIGDIATGAVDDRILQGADGCWIVAEQPSLVGRVAVVDAADASSQFAAIAAAGAGDYTGPAVAGFGDEAFCTGFASGLGSGVLVRVGNRLVFVSLFDENVSGDMTFTDDNVMYSPSTCELAQRVAAAALN